MKVTVNVQSLAELVQVANYRGKKVNLEGKPLIFPMEVFTEVDAIPHAPDKMTFEEFETKFLK